ncbi:MAG: AmmeMemoRadiSam system protein B, partial [Acidobacteriales bacterium]
YRTLERQRPERVILAGFAHHGSPPGVWIPEVGTYRTPLGDVAVDREFTGALLGEDPFGTMPEDKLCDHSVEIQLPLLQRAAPGVAVVPLYVGPLDPAQREKAAERLANCLSPGTVLVASSDLTHFGRSFHYEPFPADDRTPERLRQLDYGIIEAAGSLSPELFLETLRQNSATVCGYEPIALLLATLGRIGAGGEIFQEVLDYRTSGEITEDYRNSVSYGALGFFPHTSFELNQDEQQAILDLARRTLASYQETGEGSVPAFPPTGLASLQRRAALFVTLHQNGQLRGCIGRADAIQPMERAVPELTLASALEDTRFKPVSVSETGLEVEVSIMSPMKRIAQRGDFRVNEHGAELRARERRGLLLPQVATERRWGADQFFQALATKTRVGMDVYSDPSTRIFVFRAQIIR